MERGEGGGYCCLEPVEDPSLGGDEIFCWSSVAVLCNLGERGGGGVGCSANEGAE